MKEVSRMTSKFPAAETAWMDVIYWRRNEWRKTILDGRSGKLVYKGLMTSHFGQGRSVSSYPISLFLPLTNQPMWDNSNHLSDFIHLPFFIYQVKLSLVNSSPGICLLANQKKKFPKQTKTIDKNFPYMYI